jgi:YVTN family beta-propeller protein
VGRIALLLASLFLASPLGTVAERVPAGTQPDGLAVGAGALWAADTGDTTVTRIDLKTHESRRLPAGRGPIAVAVTPHGVAVADYAGSTVSVLSSTTGKLLWRVTTGPKPVGLAWTGTELWVVDQGDGGIAVLDLRARRIVARLRGVAGAGFAAFGDGSVWVPSFQGGPTVVRYDGATRKPVATIHVGQLPVELAFGAGSAWVVNGQSSTVSRIDPHTNRVVATLRVHGAPTGIAFAHGRVWVASITANDVSTIDPTTNRNVGSIGGIVSPRDVAPVGRDLWVAAFAEGDVARIRLR